VFRDAYIDTNIAIFRPGMTPETFLAKEFEKRLQIESSDLIEEGAESVPSEYLRNTANAKIFFKRGVYEMLTRFDSHEFATLGDLTDAAQGIVASFYEYADQKREDGFLPYRECDVYRYELQTTEERFIDFSEEDSLREYYTRPRILVRRLVNRDDRLMAAYTDETFVVKKDLNPFISDSALSLKYLLACLNSRLLSYLYISQSALALKDDFRQTTLSELRELPVKTISSMGVSDQGEELIQEIVTSAISGRNTQSWNGRDFCELDDEKESIAYNSLINLQDKITSLKESRNSINLHLPDYLTSYDDGPTLSDLSSPPEGLSQTLLTESLEDTDRYEKLRIDAVEIDRSGDDLTLSVVPYVKPVEEISDEYETNSHGYTTLDPIPAMEFRGLDSEQANLIESFVPYAVEEAGGFAGFRDGATKTITPLSRLESLTLPALDDVRDGLADYREAVAEAEALDEKIERTDALIDEIVYDLYGLTDEEIEIVEEAVGG
jgi:hypothetical protein